MFLAPTSDSFRIPMSVGCSMRLFGRTRLSCANRGDIRGVHKVGCDGFDKEPVEFCSLHRFTAIVSAYRSFPP